MSGAFTEDRIANLVVQYGCRTTPVSADLNSRKAKDDLLKRMRDTCSDLFDGEVPETQFGQLKQGNPGLLFAAGKTLFVGGMTVQTPTLLVTKSTFTVAVPRIINREKITLYKGDLWLKRDGSREAKGLVRELEQALHVESHRSGKILEMVFGPVMPEELKGLSRHLFGQLDEVPDNIQANLTFVREEGDTKYNFLLNILATPVALDQPCQVAVRADVNNRDMTKSLNQADLVRIWGMADKRMPEWVFTKLGGGVS